MREIGPGKVRRWLAFAAAATVASCTFSSNLLSTAPLGLFSTVRDGSEALVIGKIIADREGLETSKANLGFVHKGPLTDPSDVLAAYLFLGSMSAVVPARITDDNWNSGISRHWSGLVVDKAGVARVGYGVHHIPVGSALRFGGDAETRDVRYVQTSDRYINIFLSGPPLAAGMTGNPGRIELVPNKVSNVVALDITDQNWNRGIARFWAGFVVAMASPERDGYLAEQLPQGSNLRFFDGRTRTILRVESNGPFMNVFVSGAPIEVPRDMGPLPISMVDQPTSGIEAGFKPYKSQFGLQGLIFSFAYENLGLKSLRSLQTLNSVLLGVIVVALSWVYGKALGTPFGALFFVSMIGSPWVVSIGRNLYWSPFLWFLPALLSAIFYLHHNRQRRLPMIVAIGVAVFLKCLCGYEYMSAIVLFACSIFLVDQFLPEPRMSRMNAISTVLQIFVVSIAAFACALLMQALLKGGSIGEALWSIWRDDVLRRTHGDPTSFPDPLIAASLKASVFDVLATYVFQWDTSLVFGVPGSLFPYLVATAAGLIAFKAWAADTTFRRDLGLMVAFGAPAVSWFVLGKAHSFVHVHLNYVLWYFGFVAALLHVILTGIRAVLLHVRGAVKPSDGAFN